MTEGQARRGDVGANGHGSQIVVEHPTLGCYILAAEGAPELLFTENETNLTRLYGAANPTPYVKDGINDAVVQGRADAVNPAGVGTKAAAHYHHVIDPGATAVVRLRLRKIENEELRIENTLQSGDSPFSIFNSQFSISSGRC